MSWTEEQVLALSPDDSSTKAGKDLARPDKWLSINKNDKALWGEVKGSGKNPYQTQIDISNIAFKCSCPSRKFPCKHGIALFLIYARNQDALVSSEMPTWVNDWISKRAEKEQKPIATDKIPSPDPISRNKRAEARVLKVNAGIYEIRLWINDIIRNGLLVLPEKSHEYWIKPASRMIDAQAPGIASMIRRLGEINHFSDSWQVEVLNQLLKIYLLTEAYLSIEDQKEDFQKEIRSLIGWTENQEELKKQDGVEDEWLILSKITDQEENLVTQKHWLIGRQSQRTALILNFYHKSNPTDLNLIPGTAIKAELVFYPGTLQQRALIKTKNDLKKAFFPFGHRTLNEAKRYFNNLFLKTHWVEEHPVIVDDLSLTRIHDNWILTDTEKSMVQLHHKFDQQWQLLALSGGYRYKISGILTNNSFLPLGIWIDSNYITF